MEYIRVCTERGKGETSVEFTQRASEMLIFREIYVENMIVALFVECYFFVYFNWAHLTLLVVLFCLSVFAD